MLINKKTFYYSMLCVKKPLSRKNLNWPSFLRFLANLEHFLIKTLCVSIHTLPTLRGKNGTSARKSGFPAERDKPCGAGQARPPERLPFSMAFRSKRSKLRKGESREQVEIGNPLLLPSRYSLFVYAIHITSFSIRQIAPEWW